MKNKISNEVFFKRKNCRICSSKNLELALEMGISPISEKYLAKKFLENLQELEEQKLRESIRNIIKRLI